MMCALRRLALAVAVATAELPAVADSDANLPKLASWAQIGGAVVGFDDSDRRSKFEEYRDVPEGFVWDGFGLRLDWEEKPWYLDLSGIDVLQRDQRLGLELGALGRLRLRGEWDRIPHFFAEDATTLLSLDRHDGFALFPNAAARAAFTANDPTSPPAAADAGDDATAALVRGLLATEARSRDLRIQRDRSGGELSFVPFPEWGLRWTLHASGRHEDVEGGRALGTGTYERTGTPPGDTFRVLGLELEEPIVRSTNTVRLATDLAGERWVGNLEYEWLAFDDDVGSLRWTNPFNDTDELAVAAGGMNRGRFAEAELDLFPDNQTHRIGASTSLRLPAATALAGAVSYAWMSQDDAFLPYTRNTAIVATSVAGTPLAATLARPRRGLDGELRVLFQSYTLTNQLLPKLTGTAFYRFYEVDNRTASILFPGYAAFGDSDWRTAIATTPPNPAEPVESFAPAYRRQNAGADLTWQIAEPLSAGAGYEYEHFSRDERQVSRTFEHIGKAWLGWRPRADVSTRFDYRYGDRDAAEYDPGAKEFSRLRMFDQADRIRNEVRVSARWDASDLVSFGAQGSFVDQDFRDSDFGLTSADRFSVGPDVAIALAESLQLLLYYARDFDSWRMTSVAKTGGATEALIFNPVNRWRSKVEDTGDTAGLALSWTALSERLFVDVAYDFSSAAGRIDTRNPIALDPAASLSAQAFPFPDTRSQLSEVSATARYRIRPQLDIGLRYLFSHYRLDDFQWNALQPYVFGTTQDNSARYLLLDSRYSDYDAHFGQVFVTLRFDLTEASR